MPHLFAVRLSFTIISQSAWARATTAATCTANSISVRSGEWESFRMEIPITQKFGILPETVSDPQRADSDIPVPVLLLIGH